MENILIVLLEFFILQIIDEISLLKGKMLIQNRSISLSFTKSREFEISSAEIYINLLGYLFIIGAISG